MTKRKEKFDNTQEKITKMFPIAKKSKTSLCELSEEGQLGIDALKRGDNITMASVAGSGKTTFSLQAASYFYLKNILLLAYNAELKHDTRHKKTNYGLNNLTVATYHSYCSSNYRVNGSTDKGIEEVINNNLACVSKDKYDIIILDEAQDIRPLFFKLVCKILSDNNNTSTQLCLLGDESQKIYDFFGADERFLTMADQIFPNPANKHWKKCRLSQSYRITAPMANFLNKCMLQENRIVSVKPSQHQPHYIICDLRKSELPVECIRDLIESGYTANDITVLVLSVKYGWAVKKLEGKIQSKLKIPVYASTEKSSDEDVLRGKLLITTFHQSKGLERKAVLVYDFDDSYYKFDKDPNSNKNKCPNVYYVAATRASERLFIFHHNENDYFPFLDKNQIEKCCKVTIEGVFKVESKTHNYLNKITSIDNLMTNQDAVHQCCNLLTLSSIRPKAEIIVIQTKTQQIFRGNIIYEMVGDITEIAIPSFFELKIKGKMKILNVDEKTKAVCLGMKNNFDELTANYETLAPSDLLKFANAWNAEKMGMVFKTNQITCYDWLSKEQLQKCVKRLDSLHISNQAEFQTEYDIKPNCDNNFTELANIPISGMFSDCVDQGRMFEFKCINGDLEEIHYVQLAVYMYMYNQTHDVKIEKGYVYNILSDEMIEVACDMPTLRKIMALLINGKFNGTIKRLTDEEFIQSCCNMRNRDD